MIDVVKQMITQELDDLHTAAPAKIESYDSKRMVCSVTLLYKNKTEQIAPIIEVPVSFMKAGPFIIRPPYKKGDIVLVVFSERSLDYILQATPQDAKTGDGVRHRIDDAIVVHGIKLDSEPDLPAEHASDLLIMNTQGTAKVVLTADDKVIFEGVEICLGSGAAEGVPLGTSLKQWLDSHTHVTGGLGVPNSQSPEPSSKVKVI
jgi:hypothetical protein